jgi:DNA repair exonuclease SbcCD ATPase subunit
VHHKGIPYSIILKMLPLVNHEINKILQNAVPFSIYIDAPSDDDKKSLDIWIEYPNEEKRLLNLGSGMEKIISAIAIRAALLMISSLPKLNVFIIDEGFGALDSDNLNSAQPMFVHLRNVFDNIIIITHLDQLKDMVDNFIDVKRDDEGDSHFAVSYER